MLCIEKYATYNVMCYILSYSGTKEIKNPCGKFLVLACMQCNSS